MVCEKNSGNGYHGRLFEPISLDQQKRVRQAGFDQQQQSISQAGIDQTTPNIWLGIEWEQKSSKWIYFTSKKETKYTHWENQSPNPTGMKCVSFKMTDVNQYWTDEACDTMNHFICEYAECFTDDDCLGICDTTINKCRGKP